ncbi:VPS9 domain-containing protein [Entamoeba marina]
MQTNREKQFWVLLKNQKPVKAAETLLTGIMTSENGLAYQNISTTLSALTLAIQNINLNKFTPKDLTKRIYKLVAVNAQSIKAAITFNQTALLKYDESLYLGVLDYVSKLIGPRHFAMFLALNSNEDDEFIACQLKYSQMDVRALLNIDEKHFPYTNTYDQALALVNMLEKATSSTTMLSRLLDVQQAINQSLETVYGEVPSSFDADSLLSILQFLLLRSKIQHPFSIISFIESHFSKSDYSTQYGFALTTFAVATQSILQITNTANPRKTVEFNTPLISEKNNSKFDMKKSLTNITVSTTPTISLPLHLMVCSGLRLINELFKEICDINDIELRYIDKY